jgi:hypothetical protein
MVSVDTLNDSQSHPERRLLATKASPQFKANATSAPVDDEAA